MPIKGESLNVIEKGIDAALGYLERQSTATWEKADDDPDRVEAITLLHRAANVMRGERKHIKQVEHRRVLRKLADMNKSPSAYPPPLTNFV